MFKIKSSALAVFSLISFILLFTSSVLAGGGSIYTYSWAEAGSWNSNERLIYARVHLAPAVPCVGTTVTFKYENPQPGDTVNADGENGNFTFTEVKNKVSRINGASMPDCNTNAKYLSTNNAEKIGVVEVKTPDGKVDSRRFMLNFHLSSPIVTSSEDKYPLPWEMDYLKEKATPAPINTTMPGAPDMVYPVNGQTLDLEGAYMFKVKSVEGSTGYLFGLFQDGQMVYENYRDTRQLSSNGEFALWENNPFHNKFHQGPVEVWVRAYVNNKWTDARIITINLKPRAGGNVSQNKNQEYLVSRTSSEKISIWVIDQEQLKTGERKVTIKWTGGFGGNPGSYDIFVKSVNKNEWESKFKGQKGPSVDLYLGSDEDYYVKVKGCEDKTGVCKESAEFKISKLGLSSDSQNTSNKLPNIESSEKVKVVADDQATIELQKKIDELQNKLTASEQRQSALESKLDQIISLIKSIFPFFK